MNKSTLIAILVFVGLAFAVSTTMRDQPQRGVTSLSLEAVEVTAVDRVLIGGDDGIDLGKQGDQWMLDGQLADGNAVERVIEVVAGVRSNELASRSPERFADFEVDEENGKRVRLFSAGDEVADLVVGGSATGGSYVRAGDEVFTVAGIYRGSLTRERAAWFERKVFFDDVGDLERVEVALRAADPYALVKRDGAWQPEDPSVMPAGHRFDPGAAARLVRALVTLRADEIVDGEPEKASALASAADKLSYRVAGDADVRTLSVGADEDGSVLARASTREPYFTIRESVASGLRKSLEDLRDFGIVDLDPSRARSLLLVDGETRLALEKGADGWVVAESTAPLPDDFVLDPSAVMRRLSAVARAIAVREAEPAQAFDAAAASRSIVVSRDDDTAVVVAFGPEVEQDDKTLVAAIGNADDKVYLVEDSMVDRLFGGVESFERIAPALPQDGLGGIDPEALKNLPPEVRDSLLKQMAEQAAMQRAMQGAGQ